MTEFYVLMIPRKDKKIYADLHKTTLKLYLTEDEANEANDDYHIVVKLGASCIT